MTRRIITHREQVETYGTVAKIAAPQGKPLTPGYQVHLIDVPYSTRGSGLVAAYPDGVEPGGNNWASALHWDNAGKITSVDTKPDHLRKGLGRALYDHVVQNYRPDLMHDHALSPDGAAWAQGVGGPAYDDAEYQRRRQQRDEEKKLPWEERNKLWDSYGWPDASRDGIRVSRKIAAILHEAGVLTAENEFAYDPAVVRPNIVNGRPDPDQTWNVLRREPSRDQQFEQAMFMQAPQLKVDPGAATGWAYGEPTQAGPEDERNWREIKFDRKNPRFHHLDTDENVTGGEWARFDPDGRMFVSSAPTLPSWLAKPGWLQEYGQDAQNAYGDFLKRLDDDELENWGGDDPYSEKSDAAQEAFEDYLQQAGVDTYDGTDFADDDDDFEDHDEPTWGEPADPTELDDDDDDDDEDDAKVFEYSPDGHYVPGPGPGGDPKYDQRPQLPGEYDKRYYSPNEANPESAADARPYTKDFETEEPVDPTLPIGDYDPNDPHKGLGGWDRFNEYFDPPTDPGMIKWLQDQWGLSPDDAARRKPFQSPINPNGSVDYEGIKQDYQMRGPGKNVMTEWPKDIKPQDLFRGVRLNLNDPALADVRRSLYGDQYENPDLSEGFIQDPPAVAHPDGWGNKELGNRILDHIQNNYGTGASALGRHWSNSEYASKYFATESGGGHGTGNHFHGPAPNLPVLVRGDWKGLGEDPYRTNTGGDFPEENEVTMLPGAPMNISDVQIMHPQTKQWHSVLGEPQARTASLVRMADPE